MYNNSIASENVMSSDLVKLVVMTVEIVSELLIIKKQFKECPL